ncbi:MAG: hypothetical protein ACO2ZZ_14800, partial [Cyclobacteriaceae bacterium]
SGASPKRVSSARKMNSFGWFFKLGFVQNYLKKKIDAKSDGPSDDKREKATMHIWGEISNGTESKELRLRTPNGYTLTADASAAITQKVIEGEVKMGYQTPSTAYGKDLILEMKDSVLID